VESLGKKVKCVRIGNPARVIDKVLEHCLDYLITKHTNLWKNDVKKLEAARKKIKKATNRDEKKKLYFEIKQIQSDIHLLQEQTI
jgi:superfamily I DNA and/or RNA helicase